MAPPRDLIRKKALHAAATVALAFTMGCLDKDDDDDDTEVGEDSGEWTDSDSGEGALDEGWGGEGGDGGTTGGGSEGGGGTGGEGDEGGGDDGEGVSGGMDPGEGSEGGSTGADDPPDCTDTTDMAACCDELAEYCAGVYDPSTQDYLDCLYGPDFDGSTGCIPWGPPVPPRMS